MSAAKGGPSTSAKLLYRPVGLLSGVLGGMVAGVLFKQIWKRVSPSVGDDADPPGPLQSEYPMREVVLAAMLHGAVFAGVRAVVDRQGARAFQRATGEWPGS